MSKGKIRLISDPLLSKLSNNKHVHKTCFKPKKYGEEWSEKLNNISVQLISQSGNNISPISVRSSTQYDSESIVAPPLLALNSTEYPTIVQIKRMSNDLRNIGAVKRKFTRLNRKVFCSSIVNLFTNLPDRNLIYNLNLASLHLSKHNDTFVRERLALKNATKTQYNDVSVALVHQTGGKKPQNSSDSAKGMRLEF